MPSPRVDNQKSTKQQETSKYNQKKSESSVSEESDLEISAVSRSSTPVGVKRFNQKASAIVINRSAASSSSSIRSTHTTQKRSQSKVKFANEAYSEDEDSTIIDDIMSRNLIMDLDELETVANSNYSNHNKLRAHNKRVTKSPLAMAAHKRSESVTSIQEESILASSSMHEETSPKSLLETNLIFDIDELERSISKNISKIEKKSKKQKNYQDNKKHKEKGNKKVSKQTLSSSITTALDKSESSIETESITYDEMDKEETKTALSESSEKSRSRKHRVSKKDKAKSYNDDFESEITKRTKNHSPRKDVTANSYYEDFESTEMDATTRKSDKKHRTVHIEKKARPTTNAECQCDAIDLLKNSDLMKTVNVYNPSSILLATSTHLKDTARLRDLNQLTGYTMFNQAFNDILKININFVKNFLSAQRNLYEQQISSIKPKHKDY